jgi:hypothetical protein
MTTRSSTAPDPIDIHTAVELLLANLPPEPWAPWPGGWPDEIERAVLDAVFSVRARYGRPRTDGQPPTGVHRVLDNWSAHRGASPGAEPTPPLDDLEHLAAYRDRGEDLAALLENRSTIRGRLKAAIAADVAVRFLEGDPPVRHAADWPVDTGVSYEALKQCWTGTPGLGPVTWSYVCMLLGRPDVKADTMIRRYLHHRLGLPRRPTAEEARVVVLRAAERHGCSPLDLDHAIWAAERALPQRETELEREA